MGGVTGTGSRNRMCEILKAGCDKESQTMFAAAAKVLGSQLESLFADLSLAVSADLTSALLAEVNAQLSVLWEKVPQNVAAQRSDVNAQLIPIMRQLIDTVQNLHPQSEYFVAPAAAEEVDAAADASAPPDPAGAAAAPHQGK